MAVLNQVTNFSSVFESSLSKLSEYVHFNGCKILSTLSKRSDRKNGNFHFKGSSTALLTKKNLRLVNLVPP